MRVGSQSDSGALAEIILHESDRLAKLVEDFLGMARMRAPDVGAVDLTAEFAELEELNRRRTDLPERLRVAFVLAPDLPAVRADAGQLRQVLTNLVNNAVEAVRREPEPRVEVAATASGYGDRVVFTVTDNGIGIAAAKIEKIFTPFYSTSSQGTGLGMTLVSRIVDEHEGHLRVDSEVGSGTTITVEWPADQEPLAHDQV